MIRFLDYKANKIYMINVKSGEIYSHFQKINWLSAGACVLIAALISRLEENVRPHLYVDNSIHEFKVFFIGIGIFVGCLLFLLLRKRRYQPELAEYLSQHPQAELVTSDINEILNKVILGGIGSILGSIGLLVLSISLFNQFLFDSNLFSYIEATVIFLVFSWVITRVDHMLFLLKFVFDMS